MIKNLYPCLEIDKEKLTNNVKEIISLCDKYNITVAGVIKGVTGNLECARSFAYGGAKEIASSRLDQIEAVKNSEINLPTLLLRIPMLSEVSDVVRLCDTSLNSELSVLNALNKEANSQGKIHNVILMADTGDLREGFWDKDEMLDIAIKVEREMDSLNLIGIGTNLGCYGSIDPTPEKLNELIAMAETIESVIGRQLKYISGGATSTLKRLLDGNVPKRINHLRIGEGIILARDLDVFYGYDMSFLNQNVFTLKTEVVEVKDKPTHPVGKIAVDAFGKTPKYTDRGIRKRAIIAIGKVDYGSSIDEIFPRKEGIQVIGASSDHTILDIEDAKEPIIVGDILEFDINYASMVFLTNCSNVRIEIV